MALDCIFRNVVDRAWPRAAACAWFPGKMSPARARIWTLARCAHFPRTTLAKLRKNLGVDYVVTGSYLEVGPEGASQLRLDARLQDARTGEIVASLPETGTESKLIALLSQTGADLRAKLGIGDIAGAEVTKVAATIPSDPTAARLYAEGLASLRQLDPSGARDSLDQGSGCGARPSPDPRRIGGGLEPVGIR